MKDRQPYPGYTRSAADKKTRPLALGMAEQLAGLLWPPECPVGHEPVDKSGHLSASAWSKLDFIAAPHCKSCGLPFAYEAGGEGEDGLLCGVCIAKPPRFDWLRAPLVYDEAVKGLVLGLKNADRRDMVPSFARWMAMSMADVIEPDAILVPVPLHWMRLISRRYNQAAILARALARETGLQVETDCLYRRRPTPSQAGRGTRARKRNMAGAFGIRRTEKLSGRSVILVDDVYTTGATVSGCCRMLKKAGAARVGVVTLCRVVRGVDVTI